MSPAWFYSVARGFVSRSTRRNTNPRCRRNQRVQSGVRLIELLEARLSLHSSPVLDAEHLAVFGSLDATTGVITGGLVPDSSLTYISAPSTAPEKWSDPNTWKYVGPMPTDGSVPSPIPGLGATVLISSRSTVLVDGVFSSPLHAIRDDGTLRFDPHANTLLSVDTIIVEPSGVFQMGTDPTKADPLSPSGIGQRIDADKHAKIIFADPGPIDLNWDPLQFSRGLVSHGDVSIFGSTVTSFEQLATSAKAKDKGLILANTPTGWAPGDRVILTGDTATNSKNVNHDEQLQIVSVGLTADGHTMVTVTDPNVANWAGLKYSHGVASGYLADVSRNATFESQNVTVVAERGHVMFMHNDNVHVDAAGFYGLGRTDKRNPIDDPVLSPDPDHPGQMTTDVIDSKTGQRVMVPVVDANGNPVVVNGVTQLQVARTGLNPRGRYAVHFHRTGIDPGDDPATLSDSSVVDTPGWGIVNHSSNVDVDGNVVFNAVGAAYVTEAGDEIGTFNGNIAIHSQGSGAGIESRQDVQDFGHQGNGFWLQGGNVSLTNNVVAGQRAGAYVFFARGLDQKGLGVTQIPVADLVNPAWAAPGQTMMPVGNVPLRQFSGNIAFASGDGLETWFTLLDVNGKNPDQRNVIDNFTTFGNASGRGIFTPYTNLTTIKNSTITGNVNSPSGTAIARNDVTRNMIYDHIHAEGWSVGIDAPVNGVNEIDGGFFNDVKGIFISTANSRSRVVNINGNTDAQGNLDPAQPQFGTLSAAALGTRTQFDIALSSNFNPKENDITRLFNPDVIQMGTVKVNDQQLYYKQQAPDFVPFNSTSPDGVAPYVPADLIDKTNQQLFDTYGLAIGGIVAPPGATASNPRIDALIGPHATYLPDVQLLSKKYVNQDTGPYLLKYKYYDPTNPLAGKSGYVTVTESTPTLLANGWNLVTRTILGRTGTLFVYGDNLAPNFVPAANMPTTINQADIDNGSTLVIQGDIVDDSFGTRHVYQTINLNDPNHVSAVQTDATGKFVIVSFTIKDFAGNATTIHLRFDVSDTAILIKDIGRKDLPTITPSDTLKALLSTPPAA
jgi:G8 domain-containing protein